VEKAERDEGGFVNERVKHKLSIRVSCQLGRGLISWLKMPDHLWLRRKPMSGQSPDPLTLRLHCMDVWCWGVQPPTAAICTKYLREIATKHDVAWTPTQTTLSQEEELMQASTSITQPPLTYTTLNPYDPYPGRAENPVFLRRSAVELTRACVSVLCRVCDWCSAPAHWLLHPHGPRHQLQPPLHLQHTGKPTATNLA
jgi:hypothetical protein